MFAKDTMTMIMTMKCVRLATHLTPLTSRYLTVEC